MFVISIIGCNKVLLDFDLTCDAAYTIFKHLSCAPFLAYEQHAETEFFVAASPHNMVRLSNITIKIGSSEITLLCIKADKLTCCAPLRWTFVILATFSLQNVQTSKLLISKIYLTL